MSRSLKHLSRPLKAILLILLIIAIISAVFLSRELNKYARGSRSYTQIAQQVLPERLTPLPDATAEPTIPPGNTQVSNTVTVAPPPRPTLSSLEMELRQVEAILPVDFNKLHGINPSAIGWIYNQGTTLDYPVVQGNDNEYYLKHLIDGTENKLGSIFMDSRNQANFSDDITVIYGHNLEDGSMFTSLEKYKQQSFYEQHPHMYLRTPGAILRVELFSGMLIRPAEMDAFRLNFPNASEKEAAIQEFKAASTFITSLTPQATDPLLALVTCTYDFPGARFLVLGRLVQIYP